MKLKRSCENCMKGSLIFINNDILCKEKGVLSPNYFCSKHEFAPFVGTKEYKNNKCFDCTNFILDSSISQNISTGLCKLFSARTFDGKNKNACSKYFQNNTEKGQINYDKNPLTI